MERHGKGLIWLDCGIFSKDLLGVWGRICILRGWWWGE